MKIVRRYYSGSLVVLERPNSHYTLTNLDAVTIETLRQRPVDPALLPVYKELIERMNELRNILHAELQRTEAYRESFIDALLQEAARITDDWMWLRWRSPDAPDYEQAKRVVMNTAFYL